MPPWLLKASVQRAVAVLPASRFWNQLLQQHVSKSLNAVFEYLDPTNIIATLKECRRILRGSGVMSHWIDLRDEYACFDPKITPYNFLRFSNRSWQLINNPLIPLNRLRSSDFRKAFRLAGFRIVDEKIERGEEQELVRVPVAEKFHDYPKEDLLALESWLVCVP